MSDTRRQPAWCPSTDHDGERVEATVTGVFVNRWNPAHTTATAYCPRCAVLLQTFALFEPTATATEVADA